MRLPRTLLLAVFVAAAVGSIQFALNTPPRSSPGTGDAGARRGARRRAGSQVGPPLEVALSKLSRVHVGARVAARADSSDRAPGDVVVLLDTGSSVPLATVDAERRLGLEVGEGPEVASRGFSGHEGRLFELSPERAFEISVGAVRDPRRVSLEVTHLSPNRLHGAHVIAPPHLLAPVGGAVRIDLAEWRLVVCEGVEQCRRGTTRWVPSAARPCPDRPELVIVDVVIGGSPETMLLDTGAATLVFEDVFDRLDLDAYVRESRAGRLLGAGKASVEARIVSGDFTWRLGEGGRIARRPESFWVVPVEPERRPAACASAGSIGTDLLGRCRVVISDAMPRRAELACDPEHSVDGGN